MVFLKILFFSIILLGIGFAGIGVKMLFKKNYTFKKQCSTVDPNTGKRLGCACGTGSCHNDSTKKRATVNPKLVSVQTYSGVSK